MALSLAGLFHTSQSDLDVRFDRGELNQPHRILIHALGDSGIENWVNQQTLTFGPYPYRQDPSAVTFQATRVSTPDLLTCESSACDPELLNQLLEKADDEGYGYLALDLQGPASNSARTLLRRSAPDLSLPKTARWAVLGSDSRVGNLSLSFGAPPAGIRFTQRAAARASLMQALFSQDELYQLYAQNHPKKGIPTRDASSLPLARRGFDFSSTAWQPISFSELTHETIAQWPIHIDDPGSSSRATRWIAGPYEQAKAIPLDARHLLIKKAPLIWKSLEGQSAKLAPQTLPQEWSISVAVRNGDQLKNIPCTGLGEPRVLAVRVSLRGDAVEMRLTDNTHRVYEIRFPSDQRCEFIPRSQSLAGNEPLALGLPQANGKSSWIAANTARKTLTWRSGGKIGRVTLSDRAFIRDHWFWRSDHTLLAVTATSNPSHPREFHLEKMNIDSKSNGELEREVLGRYARLEEAAVQLPRRPIWEQLSIQDRPFFGHRVRQAVLSSSTEHGAPIAGTHDPATSSR